MTIDSTLFDVKASFNTWVYGHIQQVQTEVNALLGTSLTIDFYAQRQPVTYPSVRVWWYSEGGIIGRRFVSRCQIDVFTQSTPENPDDRLPSLIKGSLLDKMGFSTKRTSFETWLQPDGHIANPSTPAPSGRKMRVKMENLDGFRFIPDPDPNVWHYAANFSIEHH